MRTLSTVLAPCEDNPSVRCGVHLDEILRFVLTDGLMKDCDISVTVALAIPHVCPGHRYAHPWWPLKTDSCHDTNFVVNPHAASNDKAGIMKNINFSVHLIVVSLA